MQRIFNGPLTKLTYGIYEMTTDTHMFPPVQEAQMSWPSQASYVISYAASSLGRFKQ